MHTHGKVVVAASRYRAEAVRLLNTRTDRRNSFIDKKDKHVWVKYRFRYYTDFGAFAMRNGGGKWDTNPNLVHIRIKYKNKQGHKK